MFPEDTFTMSGAPKMKKRFNGMNVNMHYARNADIFVGYNTSLEHFMDPNRLPSQHNVVQISNKSQSPYVGTKLNNPLSKHERIQKV